MIGYSASVVVDPEGSREEDAADACAAAEDAGSTSFPGFGSVAVSTSGAVASSIASNMDDETANAPKPVANGAVKQQRGRPSKNPTNVVEGAEGAPSSSASCSTGAAESSAGPAKGTGKAMKMSRMMRAPGPGPRSGRGAATSSTASSARSMKVQPAKNSTASTTTTSIFTATAAATSTNTARAGTSCGAPADFPDAHPYPILQLLDCIFLLRADENLEVLRREMSGVRNVFVDRYRRTLGHLVREQFDLRLLEMPSSSQPAKDEDVPRVMELVIQDLKSIVAEEPIPKFSSGQQSSSNMASCAGNRSHASARDNMISIYGPVKVAKLDTALPQQAFFVRVQSLEHQHLVWSDPGDIYRVSSITQNARADSVALIDSLPAPLAAAANNNVAEVAAGDQQKQHRFNSLGLEPVQSMSAMVSRVSGLPGFAEEGPCSMIREFEFPSRAMSTNSMCCGGDEHKDQTRTTGEMDTDAHQGQAQLAEEVLQQPSMNPMPHQSYNMPGHEHLCLQRPFVAPAVPLLSDEAVRDHALQMLVAEMFEHALTAEIAFEVMYLFVCDKGEGKTKVIQDTAAQMNATTAEPMKVDEDVSIPAAEMEVDKVEEEVKRTSKQEPATSSRRSSKLRVVPRRSEKMREVSKKGSLGTKSAKRGNSQIDHAKRVKTEPLNKMKTRSTATTAASAKVKCAPRSRFIKMSSLSSNSSSRESAVGEITAVTSACKLWGQLWQRPMSVPSEDARSKQMQALAHIHKQDQKAAEALAIEAASSVLTLESASQHASRCLACLCPARRFLPLDQESFAAPVIAVDSVQACLDSESQVAEVWLQKKLPGRLGPSCKEVRPEDRRRHEFLYDLLSRCTSRQGSSRIDVVAPEMDRPHKQTQKPKLIKMAMKGIKSKITTPTCGVRKSMKKSPGVAGKRSVTNAAVEAAPSEDGAVYDEQSVLNHVSGPVRTLRRTLLLLNFHVCVPSGAASRLSLEPVSAPRQNAMGEKGARAVPLISDTALVRLICGLPSKNWRFPVNPKGKELLEDGDQEAASAEAGTDPKRKSQAKSTRGPRVLTVHDTATKTDRRIKRVLQAGLYLVEPHWHAPPDWRDASTLVSSRWYYTVPRGPTTGTTRRLNACCGAAAEEKARKPSRHAEEGTDHDAFMGEALGTSSEKKPFLPHAGPAKRLGDWLVGKCQEPSLTKYSNIWRHLPLLGRRQWNAEAREHLEGAGSTRRLPLAKQHAAGHHSSSVSLLKEVQAAVHAELCRKSACEHVMLLPLPLISDLDLHFAGLQHRPQDLVWSAAAAAGQAGERQTKGEMLSPDEQKNLTALPLLEGVPQHTTDGLILRDETRRVEAIVEKHGLAAFRVGTDSTRSPVSALTKSTIIDTLTSSPGKACRSDVSFFHDSPPFRVDMTDDNSTAEKQTKQLVVNNSTFPTLLVSGSNAQKNVSLFARKGPQASLAHQSTFPPVGGKKCEIDVEALIGIFPKVRAEVLLRVQHRLVYQKLFARLLSRRFSLEEVEPLVFFVKIAGSLERARTLLLDHLLDDIFADEDAPDSSSAVGQHDDVPFEDPSVTPAIVHFEDVFPGENTDHDINTSRLSTGGNRDSAVENLTCYADHDDDGVGCFSAVPTSSCAPNSTGTPKLKSGPKSRTRPEKLRRRLHLASTVALWSFARERAKLSGLDPSLDYILQQSKTGESGADAAMAPPQGHSPSLADAGACNERIEYFVLRDRQKSKSKRESASLAPAEKGAGELAVSPGETASAVNPVPQDVFVLKEVRLRSAIGIIKPPVVTFTDLQPLPNKKSAVKSGAKGAPEQSIVTAASAKSSYSHCKVCLERPLAALSASPEFYLSDFADDLLSHPLRATARLRIFVLLTHLIRLAERRALAGGAVSANTVEIAFRAQMVPKSGGTSVKELFAAALCDLEHVATVSPSLLWYRGDELACEKASEENPFSMDKAVAARENTNKVRPPRLSSGNTRKAPFGFSSSSKGSFSREPRIHGGCTPAGGRPQVDASRLSRYQIHVNRLAMESGAGFEDDGAFDDSVLRIPAAMVPAWQRLLNAFSESTNFQDDTVRQLSYGDVDNTKKKAQDHFEDMGQACEEQKVQGIYGTNVSSSSSCAMTSDTNAVLSTALQNFLAASSDFLQTTIMSTSCDGGTTSSSGEKKDRVKKPSEDAANLAGNVDMRIEALVKQALMDVINDPFLVGELSNFKLAKRVNETQKKKRYVMSFGPRLGSSASAPAKLESFSLRWESSRGVTVSGSPPNTARCQRGSGLDEVVAKSTNEVHAGGGGAACFSRGGSSNVNVKKAQGGSTAGKRPMKGQNAKPSKRKKKQTRVEEDAEDDLLGDK
ncbi:unnamed protein product [Amoebophrya sp. A25]|nr:unnamed protein product [Amoebophrya sp. A25]|eukprot:GSA25T00015154001.1